MPESRSFGVRAYLYALIVVVASLSAVLAFVIAHQAEPVDLVRESLAGIGLMLVISLSASFLSPALSALLGTAYRPASSSQRRILVIEACALAGLGGGLIGGSAFSALSKVWLPYTLPAEVLFMLLPLTSMTITILAGQIRFWLQETGAGREEANRQLDERARQLEIEAEVREKFLLTMAHESRTPLTSLRVSSELLRDVSTKNDDPVITRLSQNIGRSTTEMASLYASIVDIGRIMQKDYSLKPETVSLSEVVNAASEAVTPTITNRKQRLAITNGAETVEVVADRQGINRILVSILDNASKYSPSGSEIEVVVSAGGKHVVFEVKDHGAGIAPEEQEKIFQPFYRIKSADAQHGAGIGIGLTVARALAEAHGGKVSVNSTPGQGSSFIVTLPKNGSSGARDS